MRIPVSIVFFLLITAGPAYTSSDVDVRSFGSVPIRSEGRVMPMDTFARHALVKVAGSQSLPGMTAIEWMAMMVLIPDAADDLDVILVDNPSVVQAIGINVTVRQRHSYNSIKPHLEILQRLYSQAMEKKPEFRTLEDNQIILLGQQVSYYASVSREVLQILPEFDVWRAIADANNAGNQADFDAGVALLKEKLVDRYPEDQLELIGPELFYNRLDPFFKALLLFGLGTIVCLLSTVWLKRPLIWSSIGLMIAAYILVSYGIGARMWIMGRPPVTNLYSTFVFTAWMSAVLGLIVFFVRDKFVGSLCTGISGVAFLMIARRYEADGDTMGVMVAVLNSNFWLAIHVVTIMIGYAGCCFAGLIAHIQLAQELLFKRPEDEVKRTRNTLYAVLGFGLLFTFAGTVLGGIWADQSWGRFWGWDPKENGALLIVLWCSLILHARAAGMVKHVGLAVGCVLGIQTVLIAWFGVNILGVGQHSYGRDSMGITYIVWPTFLALELAFIGLVLYKRSVDTEKGHAHPEPARES